MSGWDGAKSCVSSQEQLRQCGEGSTPLQTVFYEDSSFIKWNTDEMNCYQRLLCVRYYFIELFQLMLTISWIGGKKSLWGVNSYFHTCSAYCVYFWELAAANKLVFFFLPRKTCFCSVWADLVLLPSNPLWFSFVVASLTNGSDGAEVVSSGEVAVAFFLGWLRLLCYCTAVKRPCLLHRLFNKYKSDIFSCPHPALLSLAR